MSETPYKFLVAVLIYLVVTAEKGYLKQTINQSAPAFDFTENVRN
jgi:hypothetical protein